MSQWVLRESPAEGVAVVTMSHPEIENQGSWDAISQLADALADARADGARVCVLASDVPGHWFEHAWLRDLRALFVGEAMSGDPVCWFRALTELASPDVITIAAISGDCSGGGAELGWACDLRIAEEQARFSQPEILLQLSTGIGGTARLARLIGRTVAAEMVLDGAPVSARRLYELGGVNRVVGAGEATAAAVAWARRLATRPPAVVRVLKQVLLASDTLPIDRALAKEQELFQGIARSPAALEAMAEVQRRYDAGEPMQAVHAKLAAGRSRD
jgi:enoyl-CoA hydratase/carnithine racemase